jgi:hypothetical protein
LAAMGSEENRVWIMFIQCLVEVRIDFQYVN